MKPSCAVAVETERAGAAVSGEAWVRWRPCQRNRINKTARTQLAVTNKCLKRTMGPFFRAEPFLPKRAAGCPAATRIETGRPEEADGMRKDQKEKTVPGEQYRFHLLRGEEWEQVRDWN